MPESGRRGREFDLRQKKAFILRSFVDLDRNFAMQYIITEDTWTLFFNWTKRETGLPNRSCSDHGGSQPDVH